MFNKDFFPTPQHIIEMMLQGISLNNKVVYDPEGGKGDIVDFAKNNGAKEVISSELNDELRKILTTKCTVIGTDFLKVTSDQVSHVDIIVMNPPFSADEKHISHAFNIAPAGCKIVALCNATTFESPYTSSRKEFVKTVEDNGSFENIGDVFKEGAERSTAVEIGLIYMVKPGASYENEFEVFFLEEDETEEQTNGIMSYNLVRDIVNRYIESVKIFDEQMKTAVRLRELTGEFMHGNLENLSIAVTNNSVPMMRNSFKKSLQKDAWQYIFEKLNMKKYATQQLKEDINKFVEKQEQIPFTMRNVYKMLEVVVGTTGARMDKAIEVVFDKLTKHYDENRFGLEGWKTNSHYLINRKFIINSMVYQDKRWNTGSKIECGYGASFELIEDMVKAICYITGENYDKFCDLKTRIQYNRRFYVNGLFKASGDSGRDWDLKAAEKAAYESGQLTREENGVPIYGELFEWTYFTCRAYKKGTMHFEFTDKKVWEQFNQRVAKIKGYPLPEAVKKDAPKQKEKTSSTSTNEKSKVLATFNI